MTCERLWCLDALVRSGRFMQADFVVGRRLWRWRASGRQRASEFRLIGSFYSRSNVLRRTLIHRLLTDEGGRRFAGDPSTDPGGEMGSCSGC